MLKVRVQGTKNDIRWFIRLLEREPRVVLENTSTFFKNKGTNKYKHVYTQVHRANAKKEFKKEAPQNPGKDNYCGSGKTFC